MLAFFSQFGHLFISNSGQAPKRKFWSDCTDADFQGLDLWLTASDLIFLPVFCQELHDTLAKMSQPYIPKSRDRTKSCKIFKRWSYYLVWLSYLLKLIFSIFEDPFLKCVADFHDLLRSNKITCIFFPCVFHVCRVTCLGLYLINQSSEIIRIRSLSIHILRCLIN